MGERSPAISPDYCIIPTQLGPVALIDIAGVTYGIAPPTNDTPVFLSRMDQPTRLTGMESMSDEDRATALEVSAVLYAADDAYLNQSLPADVWRAFRGAAIARHEALLQASHGNPS
jgi:hypothetical protein